MTTDVQPVIPNPESVPADRQQESTTPNMPQQNSAVPQQQEIDQAELERAKAANNKALQDSREGIWFLKQITFNGRPKKIVTQNYNGPCSFIAICNILILRGDIEILPPERTAVSYDILAQIVGEYLLHASPDVDVSAALSMMPLTQKGMDLNPLFTSPTAFRPAGDNGALKLFEQVGIPLVHGWLADPTSPEYHVLSSTEDYDTSVNLIVEADTLAKGQLVVDEYAPGPSSPGPSTNHAHVSDYLSAADRKKIEDALVVRNFLDSTSSQLTYHGLFTLASSIKPGTLVALFRNSHLSVLHRRAILPPSSSSSQPSTDPFSPQTSSSSTPPEGDQDHALYNLVTDYVFHNEPTVVWERLEDVDGGASSFVDSEFRRSNPVGGDFAGATMIDPGQYAEFDPADQALAQQLQAEEDARAQAIYAQREQRRAAQQQQNPNQNRNQNQNQQQPPFDPRDPRYAHYMEQQQHAQQQQQQQYDPRYAGQYPDQYGMSPSPDTNPNSRQNQGQRPQKMKRKTSCS
ncbi:uncharacterized protein FOMMEDRAFT_144501 [Fomitiporia mediterranea MF3/22]|uniref:uncharacterized protein n=1 Tax=Fomitiporia mediterranea (strain MF3/22) TaxID=694068 RepID=UPI0004409B88|nr:uncharacterized protein FOMMEDRAFT_144501 [Fomitiporia mediterranea MF3/22]EJD06467.1 hypothetical protein FOMMEDRAFT_144501 [Fomitiporia mediterranea MF3/22]